ncbi:hypothetical protein GCM10009839_37840 [Catenulispora yoronensis]|uniref:CBM2 domain-containing protein n=1 Tax=Catenulispora yoronensis TaxID=450799 RepID=A0ABN2UB45_9ACTN
MRILRMAALMLVAFVLCGTGTASAAGPGAAGGSAAAGCTGVLALTQTFSQPSYTPDQAVTVTVTAVNCTDQALSTHLMPYGQFADSTGGRGTGCVVIDPLWLPVTIAANGTYSTSFTYSHFSGCQASQFVAYDNFYDASGALIVAGTASVPIVPATACHVSYTNQGEWQGGFTAAISITNTGKIANTAWTLTFAFGGDQKVGSVWGAGATQNGSAVTLSSLAWDSAIAPGQTINFVGLTGTWGTSDLAPSSFALNGVTCA